MGICWSNKSHDDPAASTTVHFVSSGISQTTSGSQTTSTRASHGSNVSGNSRFSAPSGDEAFACGQIMPTPMLRIFTFAELKAATRNFRSDAVLGEGGFGKVFKGWLDEKARGKSGSGTLIAVKKLNSESIQGLEDCRSELNFQGMLSHPNLVRLLGYCWEDEKLLLVYEFMQKGSLNNHLFGPVQPLPWNMRLNIAIGAARGLAFLHTSDKQVIHRNFKSSNILLDESYTAKISDFGLARLGPSASQSHVTTRVMGTFGYAAPEYIATGHLYVKSDVYSFGVVLVEILTGLRAWDTKRPSGQHNLVEWIEPYLSGKRKITNIIDSRLQGKYPYKAAYQVAQLSLKCLEAQPKNRPSMKEVLETLEQLENLASGHILPTPNLRIFTFAELKAATRNFKSDMVLREGGFGKVFQGWLDERAPGKYISGTVIAVKIMNSESLLGFEEWRSEVNFLGSLSHPNLERLLGYCWEDEELLLVYEFMQKGSLENHLFGRGAAIQPLPWNIRLKIAIGAARGLAFLHTLDKQVIYRDIKASNILLDESYTVKISNFGLAKLGPPASQSHVTTRVMGTYDCAAPEYVGSGHLHVKSDVYGFGVVLVEILTGLPNRRSGQHNLVDWIKPYLSEKRKCRYIIDSKLQGKYPSKAAYQIAQLSLKCLETEQINRPSMKEVLETLEQLEA